MTKVIPAFYGLQRAFCGQGVGEGAGHGAQGLHAAVHDPGVLPAGVPRVYLLPVDAGGHQHLVAGLRGLGGVVDVPEGALF